ncbi:MAG: hypothetical protein LBC98_10775 [Prevotellaceae bacterium]|jgi:tetratricopeptide (TPR) repeat protein|nr:hypothetical protein [Prevotellaceae bacterium]
MMTLQTIIFSRFAVLLYLVFAVFVTNTAQGQRSMKYDNVAKEAENLDPIEACQLYQDYLSTNPEAKSNAYFRVAELLSKIMKTIDPIANYDKLLKIVENSRLYYELAANISDNEARRSAGFFTEIKASERRLSAKDVKTYIRMKIGVDSVFLSEASALRKVYTTMVERYIECSKLFARINEANPSLAEIYTEWQDNEPMLNMLIQKFDSLRRDMAAYREALTANPAGGHSHSANYGYRAIENYRIDGFSPVNFASGTAAPWDYGAWAAGVIEHYKEQLAPAINRAKAAVVELDRQMNELKSTGKKLEILNIPSEGVSRIKIPSSVSMEVSRKAAMLEFMNAFYDTLNSPAAVTTGMGSLKGDYYYTLSKLYRKYENLSEKSQNVEAAEVLEMYRKALNNYRMYTVNSANRFRRTANLKYKKQDIPMYFGIGFYRASFSGYVTKAIIPDGSGGCYLSGSSINPQGFAVAFVARSRDLQNIDWMKTFDVAKMMYDDCAIALSPVPTGGCFALISSKNVSDPELTTQTIVTYDGEGNEKRQITLPEKHLPLGRAIHYNTLTDNILLAFYGQDENRFLHGGTLDIRQINTKNEQLFRFNVNLNGDVIAVLPTNSGGFIVFGNYIDLETTEKAYKTEHAGPGIYSLAISAAGKLLRANVYPSDTPRYGIRVSGTSEGTFIISGQKGDARKNSATPYSPDGDPVFIVTDNEGKLLTDF